MMVQLELNKNNFVIINYDYDDYNKVINNNYRLTVIIQLKNIS